MISRILSFLALCFALSAQAQLGPVYNAFPHTASGIASITGGSLTGVTIGRAGPSPDANSFFLGPNAGNSTMSGVGNLGVGPNVFQNATTANTTTAMGIGAGSNITTSQRSTYIGHNAGNSTTTASYQTCVGYFSCYSSDLPLASDSYMASFGYQSAIGDYGASGVFTVYSTGVQNAVFGAKTLRWYTSASNNSCIGFAACEQLTTGSGNAAGGNLAFNKATTPNSTSVWGAGGYANVVTGSNNTGLGRDVGYTCATTCTGDVFIGFRAGYYETGADTLMIDNLQRANEADGRIKALVYGKFASTVSAQRMRFNAAMEYSVITATGAGPGATLASEQWVCGTTAGTAKKIAYAGTSSTPVTIVDNVGSGVSGC